MNLYLTFDDNVNIKRRFLNMRKYLIINSDEIITSYGFNKESMDIYKSYIVNQEICRLIKNSITQKKYIAAIYSNPTMNGEIMHTMINTFSKFDGIDRIIFLTEKGFNEEYYELYEEVLFYPTIKRVRIIECEPLAISWLGDDLDINNFV